MNIRFQLAGHEFALSTDHAASSYGIPVLVDWRGMVYGLSEIVPGDDCDPQVPWLDFGTARHIIAVARHQGKLAPYLEPILPEPLELAAHWYDG